MVTAHIESSSHGFSSGSTLRTLSQCHTLKVLGQTEAETKAGGLPS